MVSGFFLNVIGGNSLHIGCLPVTFVRVFLGERVGCVYVNLGACWHAYMHVGILVNPYSL